LSGALGSVTCTWYSTNCWSLSPVTRVHEQRAQRVAGEVEHVVDREPAVADGVVRRAEPTMSLRDAATAIARISAAEGARLLLATGAPVGYQPSVRYWRTNAIAPATAGVDIEVPE
jgi:hypothetical protein